MEWLNFFLGTPKRFLGTCTGIAIATAVIKPELIHIAVARLIEAVNPILGPVFQLALLVMAIRIMFSGFCNNKKK
jgi:hypothetical protein